jgi:type I restriction enzyme R subunit
VAHPEEADRSEARRRRLPLPKKGTTAIHVPHRTEEEKTSNGPADYALWLDNHVVGVVEAKKLTMGPQGVLKQAERYAKGLNGSPYDFGGLRCPFLYSTNGEVIWFHDVRHPLNRSRIVSALHSSSALKELLDREFDDAGRSPVAGPERMRDAAVGSRQAQSYRGSW